MPNIILNKTLGIILGLAGIILSGYSMSIQCACYYCIPLWSSGLTLFLFGVLMFYKK